MQSCCRSRGLMDKASDFESENCRFGPCRGRSVLGFSFILTLNQSPSRLLILILKIIAFKCKAVVVRVA